MRVPGFAADLEAFAREAIDADHYPDDVHVFRMSECGACGVVPFQLTIEHHTGSSEDRFRGSVTARCSGCAKLVNLLHFSGEHREVSRKEQPECPCGCDQFYVGECERFEGERGLQGFFDEGVVAGKCGLCGRNRILVRTD